MKNKGTKGTKALPPDEGFKREAEFMAEHVRVVSVGEKTENLPVELLIPGLTAVNGNAITAQGTVQGEKIEKPEKIKKPKAIKVLVALTPWAHRENSMAGEIDLALINGGFNFNELASKLFQKYPQFDRLGKNVRTLESVKGKIHSHCWPYLERERGVVVSVDADGFCSANAIGYANTGHHRTYPGVAVMTPAQILAYTMTPEALVKRAQREADKAAKAQAKATRVKVEMPLTPDAPTMPEQPAQQVNVA